MKAKIDKWDYVYQPKRLLHSKGEQLTKQKDDLLEWEKVFANYSPDNGLISKTYEELNIKKNPIKKLAEVLNRHLPKETKDDTWNDVRPHSLLGKRASKPPWDLLRLLLLSRQTSVGQDMEERAPMPCRRECKPEPLWRTAWGFLRKLKVELPYDSTIPFLCISQKKIHKFKKIDVNCSIIYNRQDMETTECPLTHEWITKIWNTYATEC